ncbi:MAG TPA: hypothetical protein VNQ90_14475 [Chthoniobacteraceae bacterium]|nr:hypothetical protein [Chthoniobacteraceae bacterium]
MIVHQEVTIRYKNDPDSRALIQVLIDFCTAMPERYLYLQQQSHNYQQRISADAVMVHRHDRTPHPAIALASRDGAAMYISNIVPQAVSEIDIGTYNSFASEFATDLRTFSRATKTPLTVQCTSAEFTLKDIIPAPKTRSFFERFLAHHPTSRHPCDIRRLDVFICMAFRYCRRTLNCHRLQRYLIEILHWSPEDAEWCCNRILTGLEILEIDRRF